MDKKIFYIPIKKKEGFTLIELMVTITIVGLLVTMATGGFLSYQAKSKQSEARTNMASIGTTVAAYRTENDTYVITDQNGDGDIWDDIGWAPQGTTRYRYWYDTVAAPSTPTVPEVGIDYSDPGSVAAADSFTAAAVGNIDNDASTDQWLYYQNRSFTIQQNDVTTP